MDPQAQPPVTFFAMVNDPSEANSSLEVRADVLPHLVMPVGPFVPALRAPVIKMISDAAIPEDLGHSVCRSAVLPRTTAGREVDITTPILIEKPGVILVGHVVDRVIEVEVVVVHPVHGIAQVVDAGERVAAFHPVGVLKEGVSRVIGAERGAIGGDRDARRLALGVDEREDFARHVVVVLRLEPTAMERVRSLVIKRIALDSVYAENPNPPLVEVRAKGADHALAFLLMFVAAACREREDRRTVIAVNGDAHVAIETVGVPTLMVTMHAVRGYRVYRRPQARTDDGSIEKFRGLINVESSHWTAMGGACLPLGSDCFNKSVLFCGLLHCGAADE